MNDLLLDEHQVKELTRCLKSPAYFIGKYAWLQQKASAGVSDKSSIIQFHMGTRKPTREDIEKVLNSDSGDDIMSDECRHYFQRYILECLHRRKNVLTLKSRRVGCSWVAAAYAAWLVNFHEHVNVLFISRNGKEAKKILAKVKFILKNLKLHDHENIKKATDASWLRGEILSDNSERISIAWRNDQGDIVNESIVESITTTDDAARGDDATFIVFDELAFYEHPDETWSSATKTLAHGGHWMAVSTPSGLGSVYHRMCAQGDLAEVGQLEEPLDYEYVKIHWSEAGLSLNQVKRASIGDTQEKKDQEWEWKFIADGTVVFNPTHLAACYKPPSEYPEVARELEIYRQEVLNRARTGKGTLEYYDGCDTSVGKVHKRSSEKDYHYFTAITKSGIQAFALASKESLSKWAGKTVDGPSGERIEVTGMVSSLHQEWPGVLYIEEDGPGHTVINRHQLPKDSFSTMVPVAMKDRMKRGIIERLIIKVEAHQLVITDLFTYQCMQVFQQTAPGKYEAPRGFYDDPVVGLALASDAQDKYGGMEFSWGTTTDSLERDPAMKELEGVAGIGTGPKVEIEVPDSARRMTDTIPGWTSPSMEDYSQFERIRDAYLEETNLPYR